METELIDPAVLESLPEQPEPPQGLNRLQKKMFKYLMFGEGSSNGRGDVDLRLRVLYRMIEGGVFNAGISFDETRDRMDEWRGSLGDTVDWCSTGELQFNEAMKSQAKKEAMRAEQDKEAMRAEQDNGYEYRERCSCDRCVAHRERFQVR
jgi:hypothetical protein